MTKAKMFAGLAVLALVGAACAKGTDNAATTPTPTPSAAEPRAWPIVEAFADGEDVRYFLQEVSDPDAAKLLTEKTGFPVPIVTGLKDSPRETLANLYLFRNGIAGPNPFGFQKNVLDTVPGDVGYSPLWLHTFVRWTDESKARELKSETDILAAEAAGTVKFERTKLVINCPVIPQGNTFPIVRGLFNGREVTYTLQEISDKMVTALMTEKTGGYPLPTVASLAKATPTADLYLFMNGISGPNPFGFQRNVIDSLPGMPDYSPLWLHTFVKWKDGVTARELTSEADILAAQTAGDVTLERSKLVINCPVHVGQG